MSFIHTVRHPAVYHGHDKSAPFFEGWYYKLVSADESTKYAIIPGIFLGEDGYAFIQVLDGTSNAVQFLKFPLDAFKADRNQFDVQIGSSSFQLEKISLDLERPGFRIQGELEFHGVTGWPVTWKSPGVMGWYSWVPKMECYHGVLGFDHQISGQLKINDHTLDFSGGRGYIEKDWGTAFPEGYVWMQSNHFQRPGVCLTASIAMIPWMRSAFRGFIVGLWIEGRLFRFATYTGASTDRLEVGEQEVVWWMHDRQHQLQITARRGQTGDLKGPTRKDMGLRVAESLNGEIQIRLLDRRGEIIFEDTGRHAGLEVAGDLDKLLRSS